MDKQARQMAREVKAMTRREIITKAIDGQLTWVAAADIIGVSARQMRRIRRAIERAGISAVMDQRGGRPRRKRVAPQTVRELCRLKREVYADFSVRHFYERITEQHGMELSYTFTLQTLQEAELVEKEPGRGKYRRRRERRPLVGMLVHLDGSTHEWIAGLPMHDLVFALDDADGKGLYGEFFEQEGTASTFAALGAVLHDYGRFCALYTDCGSHFCRTVQAGAGPAEEQNGQVSEVLRTLGIRHIRARSPQARGRSERAFRTIQGRLPQELRLAGITTYEEANRYLKEVFIPDFNRRFTVAPAQPESAFTPIAGIDLELLLSAKHERVVRNDNTVTFQSLVLQLPTTPARMHFVRCPVLVHQFPNGTLGVSYQGRLVARFDVDGAPLRSPINKERATSAQQRSASTTSCPPRCIALPARTQNPKFFARAPRPVRGATGEKLELQKAWHQSNSQLNNADILTVYGADIFNCL
jgi:transposase